MKEAIPLHGQDARRPLGLVIVVGLFFAFAVADVAAHVVRGSMWWTVSASMSALLVFLFRKLWFGDERERKIGVFFGFFVAALSFLVMSDAPLREWPAEEFLGPIEGLYAICAALYLMYAKRNPFFAARNVP